MADEKISAMPAMTALAGTEKFAGVQTAGVNSVGTPAQLRTFMMGASGGFTPAAMLVGANMNSTADQAIPIVLPAGFTKWRTATILITNPSTSLTTCQGGIYAAASKTTPVTTGTAATFAYSGLTNATPNTASNMITMGSLSIVYDVSTVYLSLTTAQGAPATADFYIVVQPVL